MPPVLARNICWQNSGQEPYKIVARSSSNSSKTLSQDWKEGPCKASCKVFKQEPPIELAYNHLEHNIFTKFQDIHGRTSQRVSPVSLQHLPRRSATQNDLNMAKRKRTAVSQDERCEPCKNASKFTKYCACHET